MKELWKDIPGYEGLYQASTTGLVKSLGNKTHPGEHIIKPKKGKKGKYLLIHLYKNGVGKWSQVHRLIYETFEGSIPEGMQINHIDEDCFNNSLDNLIPMSPKDNINWGTGIERRAMQARKPVAQLTKEGEIINRFESVKAAATALNLHHAAISKCCLHRPNHKTTGGFRWEYA